MLDQHKRFADKYFETLNGSLSAEYAGFEPNSARQQAWQLLQRDDIQEYLQSLRAEYAEKSGITKEWVIKRFEHISDACVKAKPVVRWDAGLKEFIPVEDEYGNPVYEFDSSGANKATEMLGKIIGIFEKDNDQSKPITNLNFQPIIQTVPIPLATDEKDVQL
jgi:phage terminase small subunit